MKRGKQLGGKPPRRGGRLTQQGRPPSAGQTASPQVVGVAVGGFLIIGLVLGYAWGMDRQLRGGILRQHEEARQRPDWVTLESLPTYVAPAFIAVVDPGFDERGAAGARGGRTSIPRELVRQVHLLGDGLRGEARERVMAPVLAQRATKSEVLELYLNRVYLGTAREYPVYGIFHAASEYLGKEPHELTVGEAATLAGLLLEPRIERPQERAGAVGIRRNEVLRALVASGDITQAQYTAATAERLPFQPGIAEAPMTRRLTTDTAVIRLPPRYRPLAAPPSEDSG